MSALCQKRTSATLFNPRRCENGEIERKEPRGTTLRFDLGERNDLSKHGSEHKKSNSAQVAALIWLKANKYGWLAEGFDTCDLKEAKALLDGLTLRVPVASRFSFCGTVLVGR
jgi:hypothetical protein